MKQLRVFIVILLTLPLVLLACRDASDSEVSPTAASTAASTGSAAVQEEAAAAKTRTPSSTEIPPTPTPTEPLAALVNDSPIYLSSFEKELARFERAQAELGLTDAGSDIASYRGLVLDALVERELITQAAAAQNMEVTDQMLDEKLAELRAAAGDDGNFEAWLQANQWTEEEFRLALSAEMLTEQLVGVITSEVPYAIEQVSARYIQVDDPALAQSLYDQLQAGSDFAALALEFSLDRITAQNGGDLGFFARGALLVPAVEAAAFALEPGQTSEIITGTSADGSHSTYYLVQLVERDPQRPLTADLRYKLLQQTFDTWLDAQWKQATVIRFIDVDA